MKALALSLDEAAASDILEQADWYEQHSDAALGTRWERAVYSSLFRLVEHPRLGTLCNFQSDALRDLRRLPVAGFPKHLIFYRIEKAHIVILRIIHGARDLESLF